MEKLFIKPESGIVLSDEIKASIIELIPEGTTLLLKSLFISNIKHSNFCHSLYYSIDNQEFLFNTEPFTDAKKEIEYNKIVYEIVLFHFKEAEQKPAKKTKQTASKQLK